MTINDRNCNFSAEQMTITIKDGGRHPLIKAKKRHLMKFLKTMSERFTAVASMIEIAIFRGASDHHNQGRGPASPYQSKKAPPNEIP